MKGKARKVDTLIKLSLGDSEVRYRRWFLRAALIVAVYLISFIILDFITKQFEGLPGVVAWYPPAGLTYTLLLVFGVRFAPAVTIALILSSLFIYRMPQPPHLLFLWAFIISLIYGAAAWLLRHRIRFDWQLRKFRDVAWLVLTTVFVSALLAILSVSSSALSSNMPRSEVLRSIFLWWIGETVGVLTITPFMLIYVMPWLKRFAEGQPLRLPTRRSFPHLTLSVIGQAFSLAFMFYWVFGARTLDEFRPMYLIALPLIWIALEHGFKGVTMGIVTFNFGVTLAMLFFQLDLARLGELQLLMIVNCIVGLLMGAVVTERKRTETEHQALLEILQGAVSTNSIQDLLELIRKSLNKVIYAENFLVVFKNKSSGLFEEVFAVDKYDPLMPPSKLEKSVTSYVFRTGEPLLLTDAKFEILMAQGEVDRVGTRSAVWMGAPLKTPKEMIGVMAVQNYEDPDCYSERDKEFLAFVSLQVSQVLERKLAEEALRESESKFRSYTEYAPLGVFIVNEKGRYLEVNAAATEMLGYTEPELLLLSIPDILTPQSLESGLKQFQRVVQDGFASAEFLFRRKDGTQFWATVLVVKLSEDRFMSYCQDITERKLAEEVLRENEERYRLLVETLPDGVVVHSQGCVVFANPASATIIGAARPDDLIGKPVIEFVHPDSRELVLKRIQLSLSEGSPASLAEEKFVRLDGTLIDVEVSAFPFHYAGKQAMLTVFNDNTERKQKEEEILSRTGELTTLYTLSRLLADAEELENVIMLVVRHVVESVHTTFACIALLVNDNLVMRGIFPVRNLEYGIAVGDRQPIAALPNCKRVLEQNEPVILHAGSPEVSSVERATLLLDFAQSVCLVPLRVGDPSQGLNPPLGLLILGEERGEERAQFTLDKVNLARSIGDQAASAIRRILESVQARHRLQQIASLREIDSAIAKSFDLRISLHMILKHVSEQLKVDAADVLVLNTSLQTLEFSAGIGFRSREIEQTALRSGEGQAGLAFRERRMVQIPDVAASGTVFAQPELLKAEQVAAYFAVPLIIKGQVNGVLEIYQRTPLEPDEEWLDFLNPLAGQAALAIDNDHMFYGLQRSNLELGLAYDATIEGWSHALDLRDNETEGHTQRVTEMTVKLARSFGIIKDELRQVRWGALLHDIGKMGVPDGILLKPGPLTDEEWVVMKKHPTFAYEMLSPIQYLKAALDIPYCHHEKWDGTGYPRGLKGEQIPLVARIFAVVDVWDALTSDRSYRKAWTKEKALEYIRTSSGTHFDPQVVEKFFQEFG